jgi:hypothetical protein
MLLAHAYAYAHNLTYAGACGNDHDASINETLHLIKSVGLQDILRFQCPDTYLADPIVDRQLYFKEKETLWSPAYLELLRDMIDYPTKRYNVAVHVRRGDISPCGKYSNRYLPNSHYLDILQLYIPNESSVAVFSESSSLESFDDFLLRNYSVMLDTALADVWQSILTADYIILSKSSFSFFPAMLNRRAKNVFYTPFLHPSLPGWTVVDTSIIDRSRSRVQKLRDRCEQAIAR